MTDGVKPLLALLSKGDMAGYHDLLSTTTSIQEDFFYQALGAVHAHQKQLINQAEADEQLYYRRVVILVVAAMGLSVLIALLAYVMLGRIVLRPLHTAKDRKSTRLNSSH